MKKLIATLFLSIAMLLGIIGCDDGSLPLSKYENVDVNVYFYFSDNREIFLGKTRGAQSCGQMSQSYARRKNVDGWSYICCTIRNGSQCHEKIR